MTGPGFLLGGGTRWAVYDLRICPPSFDFLTFLVLAKYHGATHVWLVPGVCEAKLFQYNAEEQERRVRSIVLPACKLYGMPYKIEHLHGSVRDWDLAWPPYVRSTGKALGAGYMVGWLRSIKSPEPFMPSQEALERHKELRGRIIVHKRHTGYQTVRNSGPDWDRWAADHDAVVIGDGKWTLGDRAAFHELASLNIGVNAGPMALSEYSTHRPYITLKRLAGEVSTNEEFFGLQGWYPGDQYPWSGKNQLIVWNDSDDYQSIEAAYQEWREQSQKELASGGKEKQEGVEPSLA